MRHSSIREGKPIFRQITQISAGRQAMRSGQFGFIERISWSDAAGSIFGWFGGDMIARVVGIF